MKIIIKIWWLFIMFCGLEMTTALSQALMPQKIDPPLGLYWGESQTDIEAASPPVTQRSAVKERDTWTVEGFTQKSLKRAILYFGKGKTLDEVELQYEEPAWTFDDYQAFFASARDSLREKYGEPIVLARYKEPNPQQNVIETLLDLLWRAEESSVQLCFYSAERDTNTWRMISLHYRLGEGVAHAETQPAVDKSRRSAAGSKDATKAKPEVSPTATPPIPQKPQIAATATHRPATPKATPTPTPTPSVEARRQMKEQALKELAAEELKEQDALKAAKQEIDQQIKATSGAVLEQWKYELAKWKLQKAQAHADEQAKKKVLEEQFK
jgi:hypothetical protein